MIRNLAQKIAYKTSTFIALTALVVAGLSLNLAVSNADDLSINTPSDCKIDAVIHCGADSVTSLIDKYNNGDGLNSAESIQSIYSYFNITRADISGMTGNTAVETVTTGRVGKEGNVYDSNNKIVARNAITAGRSNLAGSTAKTVDGTNFFVRTTNISFLSNSLPAYIVDLNGKFAFAILASCGNPVIAASVTTSVSTPKPQPKQTVTKPTQPVTTVTSNVCSGSIDNVDNGGVAAQGGNCSQNTTIVEAAAASAPTPFGQCSGLSVIVTNNSPLEVSVSATANTGNGAQLTTTSFNFGDGTVSQPSGQTTATHTYSSSGNYTVTATENFSATPAIPASTCQAQLTAVSPPPAVNITTTSTPAAATTLANTGPGNIVALFGVSSFIGLIGYRIFLTRRLQR